MLLALFFLTGAGAGGGAAGAAGTAGGATTGGVGRGATRPANVVRPVAVRDGMAGSAGFEMDPAVLAVDATEGSGMLGGI